jgi:hypothetical protein
VSYNLTTDKSWHQTRGDLEECFRKWRVGDWNIIAADGLQPKQAENWNQTQTQRTVTLRYVHHSGQEMRLTMGLQHRAVDNLRVLYLAIDSLRLNEARGLSDVLQEAYLQLGQGGVSVDPYEVLGIRPDAPQETVEVVYRGLASKFHPDNQKTGDSDRFKEVQDAYERVTKERHAAAG